MSGGPSTTIPLVASTDRANANDRANQGSTTSMPTAARAMSGTPRTGRPARCTTSTTIAITVARTIEGSGRTSTTNTRSTPTAAAARGPLGRPQARPRTTTSPTTTAQFAPDTAVRCVSAEVSIAASVVGSRPERSPIASPRSSAAPGCGRSAVARTKACRAVSVPPSRPPGGTDDGVPRTNATNAVADPGSFGCTAAVTVTREPAASTAPGASPCWSGTSRTGTRSPSRSSARTSVAVTERSPGTRSRVSSASTSTRPDPGPATSVRSGSGARRDSPTVTDTASSVVRAPATSSSPATAGTTPVPRRHRSTMPLTPVRSAAAPPTTGATSGTPMSRAVAIQATATGTATRRSIALGASCTVAPQTRTRSRSSAKRTSPMPLTSSRSSTVVNRPCSSRQAMIRPASPGPMPGRVSSAV